MKKFWIVWRESSYPGTYRHDDLAAAKTEAERLAQRHPGEKFIVMEAMAKCQVRNVVWEEATAGCCICDCQENLLDPIPF